MFFCYICKTPERFDHLLSLKREQIERKDTRFCKSVPAAERLAITLRYLASGEAQQSLSYSYREERSTVSNIVSETCIAIYESLISEAAAVTMTGVLANSLLGKGLESIKPSYHQMSLYMIVHFHHCPNTC